MPLAKAVGSTARLVRRVSAGVRGSYKPDVLQSYAPEEPVLDQASNNSLHSKEDERRDTNLAIEDEDYRESYYM
jgi:hypothetical protein